jgi:hypothetical protein
MRSGPQYIIPFGENQQPLWLSTTAPGSELNALAIQMYSMLAPSVGQCMPEQYACLDGLVCTMCTPYKPLVYFMGLCLAGAVDKLP